MQLKAAKLKLLKQQMTYIWREVRVVDIKIGCIIWTAHFWDKWCFTYIISHINAICCFTYIISHINSLLGQTVLHLYHITYYRFSVQLELTKWRSTWIWCLALIASDVCLRLVCFLSNSTFRTLEVLLIMCYINLRLTCLLIYLNFS